MKDPTLTKPSLNPFGHIVNGLTKLWKYNPLTAVLTFLSVIGSLLLVAILAGIVAGLFFKNGPLDSLLLSNLIGFAATLLYLGLIVWVSLMVAKLFLASVNDTKMSFGGLMKAVTSRLKTGYLTYLLLVVAYVLLIFVSTALSYLLKGSTPVLVVTTVLFFSAVLIAAFRIIYLDYALIDTDVAPKVRAALAKSSAVWLRSVGATLLLLVALIIFFVVLMVTTGGFSAYQEPSFGKIVTLIICQLLLVLGGTAGLASIYQAVTAPSRIAAQTEPIAPIAPTAA